MTFDKFDETSDPNKKKRGPGQYYTTDSMFDFYKTGDLGKLQAKEMQGSTDSFNQRQQFLDSNYASQQDTLNKAKTVAQQGAAIGNEKFQKYLGQKNLRSGVATGQTGSDFIAANNAYQQNRANISSDYSSQMSNLANLYKYDVTQNYDQRRAEEQAILDKYYSRNYQAERDAYSREQDDYMKSNAEFTKVEDILREYYMDAKSDGVIDDAEKTEWERLMSYYQPQYGDKLASSQSAWDSYKNTTAAQAKAAEAAKPKWGEYTSDDIRVDKPGKNFSLTLGENKYTNLEMGSTAPVDVIKAAAQNKVPNNTLFIYKGNIYIKTTDGAQTIGGTGTRGYDDKGSGAGKTQYENLYTALQKAGYILG